MVKIVDVFCEWFVKIYIMLMCLLLASIPFVAIGAAVLWWCK